MSSRRQQRLEDALRRAKELHNKKGYAMGPKQRTSLESMTRELKERSTTPEGKSGHYITCPWGNGLTCGPDTCYCSRTAFIMMNLEDLERELDNIPDQDAVLAQPESTTPKKKTNYKRQANNCETYYVCDCRDCK